MNTNTNMNIHTNMNTNTSMNTNTNINTITQIQIWTLAQIPMQAKIQRWHKYLLISLLNNPHILCSNCQFFIINDNIDGMRKQKSNLIFSISIHFQFYEKGQSLILIYNYWQNKGRYCSLLSHSSIKWYKILQSFHCCQICVKLPNDI